MDKIINEERVKEFLKNYWFLFLLALAISIGLFFAVQEVKLKRYIYSEAISGNRAAIHLLRYARKPWELDEITVRAAIAGNQNAQEVLGIKEK